MQLTIRPVNWSVSLTNDELYMVCDFECLCDKTDDVIIWYVINFICLYAKRKFRRWLHTIISNCIPVKVI